MAQSDHWRITGTGKSWRDGLGEPIKDNPLLRGHRASVSACGCRRRNSTARCSRHGPASDQSEGRRSPLATQDKGLVRHRLRPPRERRGGPRQAAAAVSKLVDGDVRSHRTALDDLGSNFAVVEAQGARTYADQVLVDHPDLDAAMLRADAVLAVQLFVDNLGTADL
jgi:hypothetical protein